MNQDRLVTERHVSVREASKLDEPQPGQGREPNQSRMLRLAGEPVKLFHRQEPLAR
jgi:hypothetical protein